MEPRSAFAATITDDRTAVGTTLKSASPDAAEALGYTPLDFLFVDRQHGTPVVETLADIVRAADLTDLSVIVRVPREDTSAVTILLDLGVFVGSSFRRSRDPRRSAKWVRTAGMPMAGVSARSLVQHDLGTCQRIGTPST